MTKKTKQVLELSVLALGLAAIAAGYVHRRDVRKREAAAGHTPARPVPPTGAGALVNEVVAPVENLVREHRGTVDALTEDGTAVPPNERTSPPTVPGGESESTSPR